MRKGPLSNNSVYSYYEVISHTMQMLMQLCTLEKILVQLLIKEISMKHLQSKTRANSAIL